MDEKVSSNGFSRLTAEAVTTNLICRKIMIRINANEVTPTIRGLFRQDEPQARRCFAVLDGTIDRGKIIVDNVAKPSWAVVQEADDGTVYFGGELDTAVIHNTITHLRNDGFVLVGMWPDDPRLTLLPLDPDYDGRVLEFYGRSRGEELTQFLDPLPDGYDLRRLDRELILRTEWGPGDVQAAGGLDNWEKRCFGYCLLKGDDIFAEAMVGLPAVGLYEPGVFTRQAQRGKGYGTIVSAKLVQEIEAMGGQTYWNCAKQNVASAAIARKLGYQIEKEYHCLGWEQLPKHADKELQTDEYISKAERV